MMRFLVLCAFLSAVSLISTANATKLSVQVGAFSTEAEAQLMVQDAAKVDLGIISVRPETSEKKGLLYKVLVGSFETRAEATAAKERLAAVGVKGYVRSADNYDQEAVRAIVAGTSVTAFFRTSSAATNPYKLSTTDTEALKARRDEILGEETTSSIRLREYQEYLLSLSDNNPGKGREIVSLGYLSTKDRSVYQSERTEFEKVQNLLRRVADGEIAATPDDLKAAQSQVAHYLHYYAHSYFDAIKAYKQILEERLTAEDYIGAAKARMELSAAIYELAKTSGFDKNELQRRITTLWADATEMQYPHLADNGHAGRSIRDYTCRIGLMLCEIMMAQKLWPEARDVSTSLISMYGDFPECSGEMAEAYCHQARIELALGNPSASIRAADQAIAFAEKLGRAQWGDANRDPLWKAYTWKNSAMAKAGASLVERHKIKQEMKKRFAHHPALKSYFKEQH